VNHTWILDPTPIGADCYRPKLTEGQLTDKSIMTNKNHLKRFAFVNDIPQS